MKAGCSIGEKPEGGGGEQAWVTATHAERPRRFLFSPLGLRLQMPDCDDSPLPGRMLLGHRRPASWGRVPDMSPHLSPQLSALLPVRDTIPTLGGGAFSCVFLKHSCPFLLVPVGILVAS